MRLIDADVLLDTTNWLVFADNKVDVAYVQVADIMRQPTVDAIPVEWINQWHDIYIYAEVGDLLNDWMEKKKNEKVLS